MQQEAKLTALESARDRIGRRLQEAIDRLEDDMAEVEFWAGALDGFARPVPDYDANSGALGHYILPAHSPGSGLGRAPDRAPGRAARDRNERRRSNLDSGNRNNETDD